MLSPLGRLRRFMLWPYFVLARIATEPSAVLEFSAGLTSVLFAVTLSWDTQSTIAVVLAKIAPMPYWSMWLFLAGSIQMFCCAHQTPSVRSQVNAACAVLWVMMGGLFILQFGIAGIIGLFAGIAFMCILAVFLHASQHKTPNGPTGSR